MKIVDLKCTVIGGNPVIRIDTDEGISGFGEIESTRDYLKPHVPFDKRFILGQDPTDVQRVMLRKRKLELCGPVRFPSFRFFNQISSHRLYTAHI